MNKQVIVCVDDEVMVLNSLKSELRASLCDEFLIEIAESGDDALELLEEMIADGYEIPLVISDYIMPDMKGDELLERIHDISPSTIQIMLTGQACLEGVTQAVNHGNLHRYISKPWKANELSRSVKQAIDFYNGDKKVEDENVFLHKINTTLEEMISKRTDALVQSNKEFRRELEKSRKFAMKSAMEAQAKSNVLADLSHEIRTPISGVIGLGELLSETNLAPDQAEHVESILFSGKTLLKLVNDTLDISKIEAGKVELEKISFDVKKLANEVIKLLSAKARGKKNNLVLDIDESIGFFFLGDPGRLCQILTNLLGNSIKFTDNGLITLSVKQKGDSNLYFCVSDDGIGVDQKKIDKIFERFGQEDASTERHFGGTGLGLPICRKLVSLMGGDLRIESEKDKGSKFFFTIPLTIDHRKVDGDDIETLQKTEEAKSFKLPSTPLQILLVEDNIINQKIADKILTSLGCEVEIAENGKEAVEKLKHNQYDITFMDCQMPVMDGYEATDKIRKLNLKNVTPIIAMTANAMRGDKEKCLEAGMDDYISKPIRKSSILELLHAWTVGSKGA